MVMMVVKTMAITNESNNDSDNDCNDNNNAYCKNGINKSIWGLEKMEKLISPGNH